MNYIEFQEKVLNCIKEKMCEGYSVTLHKVNKNNDVELIAIMIQHNDDTGAIPTIYLEDFYEQYCASVTVDDIANQIIGIYRKFNGKVNISIDEFEHFEKVKDRIMLKLINYDRNIDNLKDMPHVKILDLAFVCYVYWEDNGQRMSVTVRNSHLHMWKISEEMLYKYAYANTYNKDLVEIRNMKEVIYDIYREMKSAKCPDESFDKEVMEKIEESSYPMYVLSNTKRMFGAAMMFFDAALKAIYAKFSGSFYILPSSIHEVIVVPKTNMSVKEMTDMVTQINENELEYMEVLSDNVYIYDGDEVRLA